MPLTSAQLPVRFTPLLGRDRELDDLTHAVGRTRLITLTGPGGTGKTRPAPGRGQNRSRSFPAAVCWVELAQTEDPGLVGARRGPAAGGARHTRAGRR
jgi:hypothetical protein